MDSLIQAAVISNPIANVASVVKKNQEPFGFSTDTSLSNIIGTIIFLGALYLAFKCKAPDGGIDIIQLIAACCCSPCYLVYRLAVPC